MFYPDKKLINKLFLVTASIMLFILIFLLPVAILIGSEEGGASGALLGVSIVLGTAVVGFIIAASLIRPYYRSIAYEMGEDEMIVRVGIITQSVKHVPFRTVTNIEVKRDPFDRILGIGRINIQTAGGASSEGSSAEEQLVGLVDYDAVYERVATMLRRFRGGMSPTQADVEAAPSDLTAILDEVRAIRIAMQGGGAAD